MNLTIIRSGKAMFGPDLVNGGSISGLSTVTFPADGCTVIINQIKGKIALIERGGCMFVEKVYINILKSELGVFLVIFEHFCTYYFYIYILLIILLKYDCDNEVFHTNMN